MHANYGILVRHTQSCTSLITLSIFTLSLHIFSSFDTHFQCESDGAIFVHQCFDRHLVTPGTTWYQVGMSAIFLNSASSQAMSKMSQVVKLCTGTTILFQIPEFQFFIYRMNTYLSIISTIHNF